MNVSFRSGFVAIMRVAGRPLWVIGTVIVWAVVSTVVLHGGDAVAIRPDNDAQVAVVQQEVAAEDISFQAKCDGTTQRYVRMLPQNFQAAREYHVLIALHGHGSDRWQFVRQPRDECRAVRDVAKKFDLILISPDYRAKTSWMGPEAESDIVQIIADTKREFRVGSVFICGASMGGASCLTFAALHPDLVDGVASMNGHANHLEYEQFQEAIQASFGGPKAEHALEYKKRSAEYWPEKLSMPVAATTSGQDQLVPPDSVLRLMKILKALQRPVLLIHREQAGHQTNYDDAKQILEFVVKHRS